MTDFIIKILFWLLGHSTKQQFDIPYLFGATTATHDTRKSRWEKALSAVWKNKDFLDWLYYQCESDKENIFRGKIRADLSRGARLRTLFIVYSARLAYERRIASKKGSENAVENISKVGKTYKKLTDVDSAVDE